MVAYARIVDFFPQANTCEDFKVATFLVFYLVYVSHSNDSNELNDSFYGTFPTPFFRC